MEAIRGVLVALVTGIATAVVVLAVALLPFLNPVWVGFEQGRAQAAAWTGYAPLDLASVTNEILADLLLGPPDFDVELGGQPVLVERERSHMRDVRSVFTGLYLASAVALLVLVAAYLVARTRGVRARAAFWRHIAGSGRAIAIVVVVGGLAALLFFDAAFEVFHRLFFPAGTYLFDPRTERLVQLFPEQFWVETSIAVGVLAIALAVVLAVVAGRRAARLER